MIARALVVWLGIVMLAILNGAAREAWLIPYLDETTARAVSTLALCALVLLVAWLTMEWIHPLSTGDSLRVGLLWLTLTLAFEFLVGHYVFRTSWTALLAEYDVTRGRLWVGVLVVVLLAPLFTKRLREMRRQESPRIASHPR